VARTTPYCITSCLALLLGCSAPSSPTGDPRVSSAFSAGSLQVLITGVPEGAAAGVVVTGPGAYRAELPGSTLLTGLVEGEYTIVAVPVASSGDTLLPSPSWQRLTVPAGDTPEIRSVGYGTAARQRGTLNFRVDGMYLTQATQVYAGSVPLVAGRDAYLRVFVLSDLPNTAQPEVQVRLYHGSLLVATYTIPAPGPGVPSAATETLLSSSWNVRVPGGLVQPGLRVSAEADPGNSIAETSESDNRYPGAAAGRAVDVRVLPAFAIRLVPIRQASGLQGDVTEGNRDGFLSEARAMLPIRAPDAAVRAVYTTSAPPLQSGNQNGAWGMVLSELAALRRIEGGTRYYFGVVKTGYSSGISGMGYIGGSTRTAIGWDAKGRAAHTMAHELGHLLGRSHAPCGNPSTSDPGFPYGGGAIGVHGLDVLTLKVKPVTVSDVMGYCPPSWISDYNWTGMMAFQGASGAAGLLESSPASEGLLIWGRITPDQVVLEPAFRVQAPADPFPQSGPHSLDLLAPDGSVLRTIRFEAPEVSDLPGGAERHFAFILPLDSDSGRSLAGFAVRSGNLRATRAVPPNQDADPELRLTRVNSGQAELRWNAARYPMVLMRDLATGAIVSLARGGAVRVPAAGTSDFGLIFSDGVHSVTRQGRLLQ